MTHKFNLKDTVTLPKGLPMGMGTLKRDIQGTIIGLDTDTNGEPIYTVEYKSANSVISTVRHTTVNERDLTGEVVAVMNLDADDVHAASAQPEVKLTPKQTEVLKAIATGDPVPTTQPQYTRTLAGAVNFIKLGYTRAIVYALEEKGLVGTRRDFWESTGNKAPSYAKLTPVGIEYARSRGWIAAPETSLVTFANEIDRVIAATQTPVAHVDAVSDAKLRHPLNSFMTDKPVDPRDARIANLEAELATARAALALAMTTLEDIASLGQEKKPVALSRNEPKYVLGLDVAYDDVATTAASTLEDIKALSTKS